MACKKCGYANTSGSLEADELGKPSYNRRTTAQQENGHVDLPPIVPICSIVKSTMKKKPIAEPIISPEILEMAKKSVEAERPAPSKPCAVCGAPSIIVTVPQTADEESLCWVCRRLKISAWRDSDQQLSAQE